MVACLGHGVAEIAAAAAEQAEKISYFYNHHFTSEPQERLADRLLGFMPEMARVRFVSGGSEANETALQLARLYHVERGDTDRWRAISPAQAYHGSSMGTLALTGRRAVQEPYTPYLANHLHIPPSTWRIDPTGEAALAELDRLLERHGNEIAAFVCEPVSAAALPAYSPPERFWQGLDERRQRARVPDLLRRGRHRDRPRRELARRTPAADRARHRRGRQGARRRLRAARGGPGPAGGVRRDRSGVARVRPRAHVGRRAAAVGRRARGARPDRRARARRPGPRTRAGPARRARLGARGFGARQGGPRAWVPPGCRARRPARRRVVPAGRARRRGARGRHRVRARACS